MSRIEYVIVGDYSWAPVSIIGYDGIGSYLL